MKYYKFTQVFLFAAMGAKALSIGGKITQNNGAQVEKLHEEDGIHKEIFPEDDGFHLDKLFEEKEISMKTVPEQDISMETLPEQEILMETLHEQKDISMETLPEQEISMETVPEQEDILRETVHEQEDILMETPPGQEEISMEEATNSIRKALQQVLSAVDPQGDATHQFLETVLPQNGSLSLSNITKRDIRNARIRSTDWFLRFTSSLLDAASLIAHCAAKPNLSTSLSALSDVTSFKSAKTPKSDL